MADEIALAKREMRRNAAQRRDALSPQAREQAAMASAAHAEAIARLAGAVAVISPYRAIGSELASEPLEKELQAHGLTMALPVITQLGRPLAFRRFEAGDVLAVRKWGIREPQESAPLVEPDLMLLPLLAFDATGWRLGYGGGFYDRTLARLRARKPLIAIGFAFDEQEVDAVPHDAYDQRLDYVLSPSGLRQFA
jgi:5-formyltetrahydrofolate cyclo-ligase